MHTPHTSACKCTHAHARHDTHMHVACHTRVHVSRTVHMHANESTHMHTSHAGTRTTHTCTRPLSSFTPPACSGLRLNRQARPLPALRPPGQGRPSPWISETVKGPTGRAGVGGGHSWPHGKEQDDKKKQFYFQSENVLQTVSGVKSNRRLQPAVKVQSGTVTAELCARRSRPEPRADGHGPRLPRGRLES